MANIKCGKCSQSHGSVREVKLCYVGSVVSNALNAYAATLPDADVEPTTPATEGMYILGNRVFKIQRAVHGSGQLYAKELVNGEFVYATGMARKLNSSHRMTLEQGKEYGALYGICCRCAAPLTDEASIARGLGPVCASKF